MKRNIKVIFKKIVENYMTAASWIFPYERVARDIDSFNNSEQN